MIRNSLICKLINVQASMKENNEKKINNEHEISKLIKAFPKDNYILDKNSRKKADARSIRLNHHDSEDIMTLRRYYFLALDSFFNFLSLTIPNLQTKDEERSVCKVRSQDPENFG